MGVFVCDGGCDLLNNNLHSVERFSQDEIIEKIFSGNRTLSFVVILTPEEEHQFLGLKARKYIKCYFHSNSQASFPVNEGFFQELNKIGAHFPLPENMPVNTKAHMKLKKDEGLSLYGGYTMNNNEIKISSRMLCELFAGELDFETFDNEHKQMNSDNKNIIKEFFLRQLKQGRMLDDISIEKNQNKDDDWIKFKYGFCDAAISKYK